METGRKANFLNSPFTLQKNEMIDMFYSLRKITAPSVAIADPWTAVVKTISAVVWDSLRCMSLPPAMNQTRGMER